MPPINFKEMKSKVGIDDVAYHLGYRIDKKAGLGRYIEMVEPTTNDRIIIKNPQDKATQTFFRRDGQRGGDVISFIQANLSKLGHYSPNQWESVVRVLAAFSNTYIEESRKYIEKTGLKGAQAFDKSRYDVQNIDTDLMNVSRLFLGRGLNMDTISAFSEKILRLKDLYNTNFNNYNVAFPYTRPHDNEVVGYEVRGYKGFKSKAAGTDSSNAAWIVDLSTDKNPLTKEYVFFTESAFDTMAFYQANKSKLDLEKSIFVSIGGTFSENQVRAIMQHYKNANAVDCFDNDIPGKIYGIRMLAILNDVKFETSRKEAYINIKIRDSERLYQEKELTPYNVAKDFKLPKKVFMWKSPSKYKDWNDVIQDKPQAQNSKYTQLERLQQSRKLKI